MNTEATLAAEPVSDQPADTEVKATEPAAIENPQPAEETAESKEEKRQAKLEKRFSQLTKRAYAAEAKAEALERMYSQQPSKEPQGEESTDLEALIEKRLSEREQEKAAKSFAEKSYNLLEKAAEIGQFDIEDFIPIPNGAADAIVELDNPKLVAHLQDNPELIEKLSKMSPRLQAVEIGKLDATTLDELLATLGRKRHRARG